MRASRLVYPMAATLPPTHPLTYSATHLLTHPPSHLLTHPVTHPPTHPLTHLVWLDRHLEAEHQGPCGRGQPLLDGVVLHGDGGVPVDGDDLRTVREHVRIRRLVHHRDLGTSSSNSSSRRRLSSSWS